MNVPLLNYANDGADAQAKATLAILQFLLQDLIEGVQDTEPYKHSFTVSRWSNCREQGYLVSAKNGNLPYGASTLNVIFFEHRNSDEIHAVKWVQENYPNPLTISTADFKGVHRGKYSTSASVQFGEFLKMGQWITEQVEEHFGRPL